MLSSGALSCRTAPQKSITENKKVQYGKNEEHEQKTIRLWKAADVRHHRRFGRKVES